jgi:very-short-patch-repair endonuclease
MRPSDDRRRPEPVECRVSDIADTQQGLAAHAQLLALGLTPASIQRRRRSGYLRPTPHEGVYAVGHAALAPLAREMAAVLACEPNAVLSHHSAAAVWGMCPTDPDGPVHVTVVGRNPGRRAGAVVHRARAVQSTHREGIPVTTPVRTLIDLVATVSTRQLERAFDEARIKGLISSGVLREALARHPRCRGASVLRALATDDRRTTITRSELEERFLALIRRARLPAPEVNARLGAWSVDFLWRAQRVAVELDSYAFHTTRGAFERDREKDHALRAHHIDLLRFTWRQVDREVEVTLVRLATALARAEAA